MCRLVFFLISFLCDVYLNFLWVYAGLSLLLYLAMIQYLVVDLCSNYCVRCHDTKKSVLAASLSLLIFNQLLPNQDSIAKLFSRRKINHTQSSAYEPEIKALQNDFRDTEKAIVENIVLSVVREVGSFYGGGDKFT